jgi:O-antigen/teichoic acid export membrane protein
MSTVARTATPRRAAHDIVMQVVVRILNLALGVFVTALLARTLGAARYGQWATIFVVLTLVSYFVNFGMETVVVREAARDPEHEGEWLGAANFARLVMLGPVVLSSIAAIVLLHQTREMLIAGLVLVIAMPFNGLGTLRLVFQLRVNNRIPMMVLTLHSILWATAVVLTYASGGGMIALAIGMAATTAVGSVVQTVAALRLLDRWPRPSRARLSPLLHAAIPLGVSGLLVIAYARIDQVLVFAIAGSRDAGLYGAVYNIVDQAHFVPISIMTTMAPIIAASWPQNRARMFRGVSVTAELMAISSLGGLAFVAVASEPVVRLILGPKFVSASAALPVLGAAFVFICFDYLISNVLVVLGRQRRLVFVSLLALAVNVVGNVALIPLIGFMGAAWMTLVTEIVVFLAMLAMLVRALDAPFSLRFSGAERLGRTVAAAVLLGGTLAAANALGAPFGVLVILACVAYPALLYALGVVRGADLRLLLRRELPA